MTVRHAACVCGQLTVECEGEPVRVSICHCLDCRRRTGSAFGVQARFREEQVRPAGDAAVFVRTADSGRRVSQRFCPQCGTTVWWTLQREPGIVAVAVGAFADPGFPAPWVEVYRERRSPWAAMPALAGIESHP